MSCFIAKYIVNLVDENMLTGSNLLRKIEVISMKCQTVSKASLLNRMPRRQSLTREVMGKGLAN